MGVKPDEGEGFMKSKGWDVRLRDRKRKDARETDSHPSLSSACKKTKLFQGKASVKDLSNSPFVDRRGPSCSSPSHQRRSKRLEQKMQPKLKYLIACHSVKTDFMMCGSSPIQSPSSGTSPSSSTHSENSITSVPDHSIDSGSSSAELSEDFPYLSSSKFTTCSELAKRRHSGRLRGSAMNSIMAGNKKRISGMLQKVVTVDSDTQVLPHDPTHIQENGDENAEASRLPDARKIAHEETSDVLCSVCQSGLAGNLLLLCDTDDCHVALHTFCLYPPIQVVPAGAWVCPTCEDGSLRCKGFPKLSILAKKKMQSIVGRRWVCIDADKNVMQEQCLIKWASFSHHHDTWVPIEWLYQQDRTRFCSFRKKIMFNADREAIIDLRKPEWFQVDRVIACRQKSDPSEICELDDLFFQNLQNGQYEYLVKWKGLEYADSTWETSCTEEILVELNKFVERHQKATDTYDSPCQKHQNFQLDKQPCYLPGGSALFEYQIFGVNWILRNFQIKRNVILADEMGLGKTAQVISFLSCMKEEHLNHQPALIVAPKSTLPHWEQEFRRWAENLNVLIYQGEETSRHCIQKHELYSSTNHILFDALVTNYELVRLDNSIFRKVRWSAIIIDEAHKMKNLDCKLTRCLNRLIAEFRLLLTGTPLQNTLLELFALLHFLDPQEFSDPRNKASSFSTIGMDLMDNNSSNSDENVSQIHNLLAPRMLRRMKSEVLFSSMPTKKWVEVPCALTDAQRQLYVNMLKKNYKELNKGLLNGRKFILNFLLMELRKCCNHPYLFPGQESLGLSKEEALSGLLRTSGKLQLLEKLLPKLKARGNRVLLFSQMTRMLDILEDFLVYLGLTYFRIDGQTDASSRQQQIRDFNEAGCEVFVFLISTRAGGLGIDLPTADRVIIYDPDFNPFSDLQAQSRAHRIGQSRPVVVYQLITKCTVEEKILQKSKRKLAIENLVMNPNTKLDVKELHSVLLHGAKKLMSKKTIEEASIIYDDNAIETLLSMDPSPDEKCAPEDNGYLGGIQSFIPLPDQEPNQSPKANEWSKILADCDNSPFKAENLGRGKRQKRSINYFQEDREFDEETKDKSGSDKDEENEDYTPETDETSSDDSSSEHDDYAPDMNDITNE